MKLNRHILENGNGKKIKIRLIELEMSQTELAEQIGASRIYMNHIISGYRAGDKYLKAIEDVLGISLESANRSTRWRMKR